MAKRTVVIDTPRQALIKALQCSIKPINDLANETSDKLICEFRDRIIDTVNEIRESHNNGIDTDYIRLCLRGVEKQLGGRGRYKVPLAEILKYIDIADGLHIEGAEENQLKPLELFSTGGTPEKYKYLWYPYLVENELNVMFGAGMSGKGFLCGLIASHIMTGKEFPNGESCTPGDVLLYTAEEDGNKAIEKYIRGGTPKETTDTRLHIIDRTKVREYAERNGTEEMYPIEKVIASIPDLKLIIIDPIENFLPSDINPNSRSHVSIFLSKLAAICTSKKVTIMYIVHENKKEGKGGGSTNNKASGSGSFIDVPRSALQVVKEWDEEGNAIHYVTPTKFNTSAAGDSYKFIITDTSVEWDGVIDRSRALLDKARYEGITPGEYLKNKKTKAEIDNRLLTALCKKAQKEYDKLTNKNQVIKVSYNDMEIEYGEGMSIWNGEQPKKALNKLIAALDNCGIMLYSTSTGTVVKQYSGTNGHTSERGFIMSVKDIERLNMWLNNDLGIS